MTDGLTAGFITNVSPLSGAGVCDVVRACPTPNGSCSLPWPTLQAAFDAGARSLVLAPGTYGALDIGNTGETIVLTGDQIYTAIGALVGAGGSQAFLNGIVTDALSFSDNDNENFFGIVGCEVGTAGGLTFSGGAAGGHGAIAFETSDFGVANTFANFAQLICDNFSERQMLSAGSKFTSSVAGPIALQATGALGNAVLLVDRDETVTMTKRLVLGKSQYTANRAVTVTPSATVGQTLVVDSYNNSGFTCALKLGGATIVTVPSSPTASRYRLQTTVANTTWALDSVEQLV